VVTVGLELWLEKWCWLMMLLNEIEFRMDDVNGCLSFSMATFPIQ
jgi:hypothetical protein